jgi:translation initiation factor 1 (eIF-1/SUI1)
VKKKSENKEIVVSIDSADRGREVTIVLTSDESGITPNEILEALVQVFEEECDDADGGGLLQ